MTGQRVPPRFVPTLTVVIEPGPDVVSDVPVIATSPLEAVDFAVDPARAVAIGPTPLSDDDILGLNEDLVDRVLQRVDRSLEDRLSDAVAAAVQAQLDVMVPLLRAEIEGVLRKLVAESLAAELSEQQGSAPFSPL